jgi:hypothetical protein
MNTVINAPMWADTNAQIGTLPGDLQQLINIAGPLASGKAVALRSVQLAQMAESDGERPALDDVERGQLIGLCAVSAQLLGAAALDACNALTYHQGQQHAR